MHFGFVLNNFTLPARISFSLLMKSDCADHEPHNYTSNTLKHTLQAEGNFANVILFL